MYSIKLPEGFRFRTPTLDDAPEIAALVAACQEADGDHAQMTTAELLSDWSGVDLAQEAIVVLEPHGQIVGYADLINRNYVQISVYGHVHPAHRVRGVGTALVAWGERWAEHHAVRAPTDARITVQHFLRETNTGARQLVETNGYIPIRIHYIMAIDLDHAPPTPTWPDDLGVRSFVVGQDEQQVFEAAEESFQDIWNRPPSTYERWMASTTAPDFDPGLWFLGVERATDTIAGVCLCTIIDGTGYVNTVAVRRPWRRRGLGRALLEHAFSACYMRGVRHIELNVDGESTTGAPQLYGTVGMAVAKSYVRYEKEIRAGVDQATNRG
jgi:mycothiol synthase